MKWPAVAALVIALLPPASAGAASGAPDLAAFSGCIAVHNAVAAYGRGGAPTAAEVVLIWETLSGSRSRGARPVWKAVKKSRTPARTRTAIAAAARWCTAIGVAPITVPTTASSR